MTGAESGLVTNTITVVGVPFFQGQNVPDKQVNATNQAQTLVIEPGITLTKTASASAVIAGSDVTYTFVVSNTGDVGMPLTGPTDDKCSPVTFVSGDTNGNGLLDGADSGSPESWTFTCTRTLGLPAPPATIDENVATVTAVDPLGNTYTAQAFAEVRVIRPAISLTKTASASLVPVGTIVDYEFAATNSGTSPLPADDVLAEVHLADLANPAQPSCILPTFTGGDTNNNNMLDRIPAEVWTYECSSQPTQSTTNIATVVALGGTTLQPPLTVGVGAAAGAFVEVFNPGIAVTKTASPTKLVGGGDVTYTYQVTNTGDVPLADVSSRITDDKCSPLALVSGDTNNNGLLDTPNSIFEDHADETWIYTCTTAVSVTTTNTVDVTGTPTDAGGTNLCETDAPRVNANCDVRAQNNALVQVVDPGQITIVKATTAPSGQSFAFTSSTLGNFSLANGQSTTVGDLGTGTYSVTEAVPTGWQIASIVCDDPTGDSATDPATGVASIALAAGESVTCTYTNHQPRIPDTGSNSTQPLVAAALALVVLGAGLWILSAGRRRRRI